MSVKDKLFNDNNDTSPDDNIILPEIMLKEITKEAHKEGLTHAALELLNPIHLVPIAFSANAIRKGIQNGHKIEKSEWQHIALETGLALSLTALSFFTINTSEKKRLTNIYKHEYNHSDATLDNPDALADEYKLVINTNTAAAAIGTLFLGAAATIIAKEALPDTSQFKSMINTIEDYLPKVYETSTLPLVTASIPAAIAALGTKQNLEQKSLKETNEIREKISHAKKLINERVDNQASTEQSQLH